MSEQEIPRNIELDPRFEATEHFSDKQLRYEPEKFDQVKSPFDPLIVDRYPDGRAKKGLCGRDSHGKPVIPPELQEAALMETPTSQDLAEPRIHDRLAELGLISWPIFENPPAQTLEERSRWQEL